MRNLLAVFILIISSQAFSVCMEEIDGIMNQCISLKGNKDAEWFCTHKYGPNYLPYYTTDTCSKELAYRLRGTVYKETKYNQGPKIVAACMSYEVGTKRGCQYYNYDKAEDYCRENHGGRYVPFIITPKCSMEFAAQSRGEDKPEYLIEGLDSQIELMEKTMTMIDKEGVFASIGGAFNARPTIGTEFYTGVIKQLMGGMNDYKKELYKRSKLNVPVDSPQTTMFLKYAFRYLGLQSRLYKIYAFVAHKNNHALKTYNFSNLDYLNLRLRKKFGLEILARVNYLTQTENNGQDLVFMFAEQERQVFEYQAISKPDSTVDYAKLVAFMGVRENFTNYWGVQRMTKKKLAQQSINSCGEGFLSFRPGKNGKMTNSAAYEQLVEFDVFTNDYAKRFKFLAELSQMINILNEKEAADLIFGTIQKHPEVRKLLNDKLSIKSNSDLRKYSHEDAKLLNLSESEAWKTFAEEQFGTVIMLGDGVLNKNTIISRIAEDAYNVRSAAIIENFLPSFVWISDAGIKQLAEKMREDLDRYYKSKFVKNLKAKLITGLHNYNNQTSLATNFYKEKVDQTLSEAYLAAKAAYVGGRLKDNKSIDQEYMLGPLDIEELIAFFHAKIDQKYYDLKRTMEEKPEMAKISKEFFDSVATHFQLSYPELIDNVEKANKKDAVKMIMVDRNQEFRDALRDAAIKAAYEMHAKYPYIMETQYQIGAQNYVVIDREKEEKRKTDNYAFLQSFKDNCVGFQVMIDDLGRTHICKHGTTPDFLSYRSNTSRGKSGYNPDGITTGRVLAPQGLTPKGGIVTSKGVENVENNEIFWLGMDSGFLSEDAVVAIKNRKDSITGYKDKDGKKIHLIEDERTFLFRMLHALNLEWVGIANPDQNYFGTFSPWEDDQMILASQRVNKAYQASALLRQDVTWHTYTKNSRGSKKIKHNEPLLIKIAKTAFNPKTGQLDISKAKKLIEETIAQGVVNIPNKLSDFCKANYLKYTTDEYFKQSFEASSFIRKTLQAPVGISLYQSKLHQLYDKELVKSLRSKWEVLEEDYFSPILLVTGTAAMTALAIILIAGTGGAAAPGILGGLYVLSSTFLAVEFFASAPFAIGSLYARYNIHFVEVPGQLKYQKALGTTQIESADIVDWDILKEKEKENRSNKIWTAALAPLDFLYGAALFRHVRSKLGFTALKAYNKLTKVKIKGWGAPPASMLKNKSFDALRQRHGKLKAIFLKAGQAGARIASFVPRYQPIAENLIKSVPLRLGIARRASELGIHEVPWVLKSEINSYVSKLKDKLKYYQKYSEAEKKLIDKVRLNGKFTLKDMRAHGLGYHTAAFLPKSLLSAMKKAISGQPKVLLEYFTKFGDVWDEMRHVQGELIAKRVAKMEEIMKKMDDLHQSVMAGNYGKMRDQNFMEDMLRFMSDEEILALEEVVKYGKGTITKFKNIFKLHHQIVEDLRPMGKFYSDNNIHFDGVIYPHNIIMGEKVTGYKVFKNPLEDLKVFYQSIARTTGVTAQDVVELKRLVELQLLHLGRMNARGHLEMIDPAEMTDEIMSRLPR